jgi:hypothetical protein
MQSSLTAAHMGHRSSLSSVASAVRWALPLVAAAMVAVSIASAVTSANVPPAVVVNEAWVDTPHLVP